MDEAAFLRSLKGSATKSTDLDALRARCAPFAAGKPKKKAPKGAGELATFLVGVVKTALAAGSGGSSASLAAASLAICALYGLQSVLTFKKPLTLQLFEQKLVAQQVAAAEASAAPTCQADGLPAHPPCLPAQLSSMPGCCACRWPDAASLIPSLPLSLSLGPTSSSRRCRRWNTSAPVSS